MIKEVLLKKSQEIEYIYSVDFAGLYIQGVSKKPLPLEIDHCSYLDAWALLKPWMRKKFHRMHILKIFGIKISLKSEIFSPGNWK